MFQAVAAALKGRGGEAAPALRACNTGKTFDADQSFPVYKNYFIAFSLIFFSILAAAFSSFFRRLKTVRI